MRIHTAAVRSIDFCMAEDSAAFGFDILSTALSTMLLFFGALSRSVAVAVAAAALSPALAGSVDAAGDFLSPADAILSARAARPPDLAAPAAAPFLSPWGIHRPQMS